MKVWLLLSRFDNGGLERVVINIVKYFIKNGIKAEIVAGRDEKKIEKNDGIFISELPSRFTLLKLIYLLIDVFRKKPTHIFTTSNDYACFILVARIIFFIKVRVIVTQHLSVSEPVLRSKGLKKLKLKLLMRLMRLMYPHADRIVAVSYGVKRDLVESLRIDSKLVDVIYNPVIDDHFYANLNSFGNFHWIDDSIPTVIFVGRLSEEKRLDLIFSAMDMLESVIDANLLILGCGPLFSKYEEFIKSSNFSHKWKMLGFVENPLPFIKRSTVLVLASDFEGLPTVLIEALGCGTQIIASDCPSGPAEILNGGEYGQLIPVDNALALKNAIEKSINRDFYVDPKRLVEYAAIFSVDTAIERYMKLL
jgi:glycosyltransferase involved in cell wall biosynthesis